MTKLQIWTLQPLPVWERLQKEDVLYTDISLSPNAYIFDSYEWMRQQMSSRLPRYEWHYPWWGYHRPKPDLRKFRFSPQESGVKLSETKSYVRLELSLEEKDVLLHDRSAWDTSLIPGPIVYDEVEEKVYWALSDSEQEAFIVSTRERIFDVEGLRKGTFYSEDQTEAVFEALRLADVVQVREYNRSFYPSLV